MERTTKTEQIVAMLSKGMIEPRITVVGCGGAGNNIVQSMYLDCRSNVETIALNTDEKKLDNIEVHKKLLIGRDITHGQGAGGFPEVGEYCAEAAKPMIKELLKDSDIVFIVAGMGGGTGTGAAPVVAQVSKELDAVTFAIAITPFSFETERIRKANDGIRKLKGVSSTTIVLDNDRLVDIAGDISVEESFSIMQRSINKIIDSLCTQISESFISQIVPEVEDMVHNLDEADEVEQGGKPENALIHAAVPEPDLKVPRDGPSTLLMR
jgi:cell division protein FtsZ